MFVMLLIVTLAIAVVVSWLVARPFSTSSASRAGWLVVFVFALVAYVVVRGFELKYGRSGPVTR